MGRAAAAVVPKPANVPWDVAGGLCLAGTTTAHLLAALDVRAGQTLLVHGAAGGVGQLRCTSPLPAVPR